MVIFYLKLSIENVILLKFIPISFHWLWPPIMRNENFLHNFFLIIMNMYPIFKGLDHYISIDHCGSPKKHELLCRHRDGLDINERILVFVGKIFCWNYFSIVTPSKRNIFEMPETCLHEKTKDFLFKMFCLCFFEYFNEKYHLLSIFCTTKYKVNSIYTRVKVVSMQCQNHIHVYLLSIFRLHFKECQQGQIKGIWKK